MSNFPSNFLLFIALPMDRELLAEQVVKSAVCFLEASGKVERAELGAFRRVASKGKAIECMKLVRLGSSAIARDEASGRARSLEGVLRSTLGAAGVPHGDVRVFVSAEEGAA